MLQSSQPMPITPSQQVELKKFWDDGVMSQVVKEFLFMHLDTLALERVYDLRPTEGIADAKEVIDKAFDELDELFEPVEKKKEPANESR